MTAKIAKGRMNVKMISKWQALGAAVIFILSMAAEAAFGEK